MGRKVPELVCCKILVCRELVEADVRYNLYMYLLEKCWAALLLEKLYFFSKLWCTYFYKEFKKGLNQCHKPKITQKIWLNENDFLCKVYGKLWQGK